MSYAKIINFLRKRAKRLNIKSKEMKHINAAIISLESLMEELKKETK